MWLDFDSLVNARDLGGLPSRDGRRTRPGRLLRSDNLQDLTDADIVRLSELGVSDVVDLRTGVEVRSTGPGPLIGREGFTVHHHSCYREPDSTATGPDALPDTAVPTHGDQAHGDGIRETEQAPWIGQTSTTVTHDDSWASIYLSYVADRPDSMVAALRVIAGAEGATLVHCAAGKDRTGTVVALALLIAGVEPDAIVDDYVRSGERTERIIERLLRFEVYRPNLIGRSLDSHATRRETMAGLMDWVAHHHGDADSLLAAHGWTPADTAALRAKLLDD